VSSLPFSSASPTQPTEVAPVPDLNTPLAAMLPPELRNADVTKYFPEFRKNQVSLTYIWNLYCIDLTLSSIYTPFIAWANSLDPDQSAHLCCLIRICTVRV
jgi:hypothetical protein